MPAVSVRQTILSLSDRAICALIVLLILGSTVAFAGAVWWFAPVLAIGAFLLVLIKLTQHLLAGHMPILKSPLTLLGLLVLALAVFQLAPLPPSLASHLSPAAHDAYARGLLPFLVHEDEPDLELPNPLPIRSPATLDRSGTLRWLVSAAACLGIFWVMSHFTDRLSRLYLVWGLVIAGFLLNTALAIVQITNRSNGLYGIYLPGSRSSWAPTLDDMLSAPASLILKDLPDTSSSGSISTTKLPRAVLAPNIPFLFGTLMGGSGAFLAMGTLAMPLALAIVFHLVSPRGSRESLLDRLGQSGQGSLVVLVVILMFLGAVLTGLIAGSLYCLPLILGLAIVIIPAICTRGLRWVALGSTLLLLTGLGAGIALQKWWPLLLGGQAPVEPPNTVLAQALWNSSLQIIRTFPLVGSGLGSFPTVHPYFKTMDISSTTAMSSLLQWAAETGFAGLGILALGMLWCVFRLPAGVRRISSIDRSLAHGLIGAAVSLGLLATVHWTVELSAVAISASALGGTWNRWLAGGTDLFVERG
jgi:hypothetical protein